MKREKDAVMLSKEQIIWSKLDRIRKLAGLIQKNNDDAELVLDHGKKVEEEVKQAEELFLELFPMEKAVPGSEERFFEDHLPLAKRNILLALGKNDKKKRLKKILEEMGATVFWVEEGKRAVDAFQFSRKKTFDAIFIDVRISPKGGFLTAKAIRACDKEDARQIPIIAVLCEENEEDIRKAQEADMDDWLAAPFKEGDILEVLESCINNHEKRDR